MADGVVIKINGDDSGFQQTLRSSERSARSAAAAMAQEYRRQGMSMSAAMKRAWSEVAAAQQSGASVVINGVETIIRGQDQLSARIRSLPDNAYLPLARSAAVAADGIERDLSLVQRRTLSAANGIRTALRGVALATGALSTAWSAASLAGVRYNASIEQLQISFETMTGSAEKGAEVLGRIRELGAKTPFETAGLAETVQLLMNYNLTADRAINVMSMLGDVAQGDQQKLTRIATAYGQMSSAGKVALEDVKQMTEAGFNPLAEISESTGESMASLYDRISKGTLAVDEITQSMVRSTSAGGKYFQSMEKQSQTLNGRLSTLKDNAMSLLGSMVDPVSDALRDQLLPEAIDAIDELNRAFEAEGFDGLTRALQKQIPKAGQALKQGIKGLLKRAGDAAPGLVEQIIGGLPQALDGAFDVGGDLADALFDLASYGVQGLAAKLPELAPVLLKGAGRLGQALLDGALNLTSGLISGLFDAFNTSADEAWAEMMNHLTDREASANVAAQITATVDSSGAETAIQDAYDRIYEVLTDGAPDTPEAMAGLKKDIGSTVNALMEAIDDWERSEIAKLDVNSADYAERVAAIQATAEGYRKAVKSVETETVSFITGMAGKSAATVEKEKGRLDELQQRLAEIAGEIDFAGNKVAELDKRSYELTAAGAATSQEEVTGGVRYAYQSYKLDLQKIEEAGKAQKEAENEAWKKGYEGAEDKDAYNQAHKDRIAAIDADMQAQTEAAKQVYAGRMSELLSGLREIYGNDEGLRLTESLWEKMDIQQQLNTLGEELRDELTPERAAEIAEIFTGWYQVVLGRDEESTAGTLEWDFTALTNGMDAALTEELKNFDAAGANSEYLTLLQGIFSSGALEDFNIDTSTLDGALSAAMGDLGANSAGGFAQGVEDGKTVINTAVTGAMTGSIAAAKSALDSHSPSKKFMAIGADAINGMILGVNSRRAALIAAVRSIALAAAQAARSALQINSPSKVFAQIGDYTGQGFEGGLKRSMMRARATMGALMNPAYLTGGNGSTSSVPSDVALTIDYDRLAAAMAQRQTVLVSNGRVLARSTAADNSQALGAYKRRVAMGYGG